MAPPPEYITDFEKEGLQDTEHINALSKENTYESIKSNGKPNDISPIKDSREEGEQSAEDKNMENEKSAPSTEL